MNRLDFDLLKEEAEARRLASYGRGVNPTDGPEAFEMSGWGIASLIAMASASVRSDNFPSELFCDFSRHDKSPSNRAIFRFRNGRWKICEGTQIEEERDLYYLMQGLASATSDAVFERSWPGAELGEEVKALFVPVQDGDFSTMPSALARLPDHAIACALGHGPVIAKHLSIMDHSRLALALGDEVSRRSSDLDGFHPRVHAVRGIQRQSSRRLSVGRRHRQADMRP